MGVATAIKRSASMTMLRAALCCMTSFRIGLPCGLHRLYKRLRAGRPFDTINGRYFLRSTFVY